jgi:hypothetical protein
MKRPLQVFDSHERAILLAMYEFEDGVYTSYTLASKLNPEVKTGSDAALTAFTETREATERLIVRGLVRGERLRGANGVYFNHLKLTPKGEKTAIQQRSAAAEEKKALEEAVKRSKEFGSKAEGSASNEG